MTAPFEVGSRVVCPDPTGRRFVGVVQRTFDLSFREDGEDPRVRVVVSDGAQTVCVGVEEVRPVMPHGPEDLKRWGRWWWRAAVGRDPKVVQVCANVHNEGRVFRIAWYNANFDDWSTPTDDSYWRGPVQPPPVVRG